MHRQRGEGLMCSNMTKMVIFIVDKSVAKA